MLDQFGRKIEYMRISLTNNCNLRCSYCMPEKQISDVHFFPMNQVLRCVESAVSLGITHFRLTGGEPLCYPKIEEMICKVVHLIAVFRLYCGNCHFQIVFPGDGFQLIQKLGFFFICEKIRLVQDKGKFGGCKVLIRVIFLTAGSAKAVGSCGLYRNSSRTWQSSSKKRIRAWNNCTEKASCSQHCRRNGQQAALADCVQEAVLK